MATPLTPGSEDYELLTGGQGSNVPSFRVRRSLRSFLWHNPVILVALTLGTCGTLGCFAFTFWLSQQLFNCPDWALYCSVSERVRWMSQHLNQVQGVLSTVFGVFMSMVAYAAYQIAETTIWPALTRRTFTLRDIDRYLATSRGAYTSSPAALWHARGGYHVSVLVIVTLTALLLEANSVIVGHAFSLVRVPTTFYSNHTAGGGTGFGFTQLNPPGMLPGAIGNAFPVYNAWANGLSSEPMPDQRHYIVDRSNLTHIGNFSVHAVEAQKQINCSSMPINITQDVQDAEYADAYFYVATSLGEDVQLRLQGQMTLWVDQWEKLDNSSATTRIVFAAINGSIEGGADNQATDTMLEYGYTGISSLACDVRISLADSTLRVPQNQSGNSNATLSSLATLNGDDTYRDAVWLAAVLTTFGVSVYGCQPMFSPGTALGNETLALPIAYTSWAATTTPVAWTKATLTNFIEVGSGALGMVFTRSWEKSTETLVSTQKTQRLHPTRPYFLLIPLALVLGSVLLQALVSTLMYRSSDVAVTRLGSTSEIIVSGETNDMKAAVEEARKGSHPSDELVHLRVRYGMVAEGYDGLARKERLTSFPKKRGYAAALNKVI
ncbi:hypothetical protein LTR85_008864 [Meristemomyces frigidus]|nr:hypothetical protein LTR85_008864 [Meristemomyces frigidus]